ncbi:unnamed protein product [Heterobilharzia americana]|nr:unnamed protein product [Heterobilharzia americana]
MALEVPLSNVENTTMNKNGVIFEFLPNDEVEICLSEMRLYTPGNEANRQGKAPIIYSGVTQKADIIRVTGDFLIEFKQLQCLQPRGRYVVELYPSFIHLHGKSFDLKTVGRFFLSSNLTHQLNMVKQDTTLIFFFLTKIPMLIQK